MKLVLIFLSTIFIITLNTNINANTIKNKNHKVTIKNSKKINTNNQDVLISKPTKPKINIISSYKDTEFTKTNTDTYFPGYNYTNSNIIIIPNQYPLGNRFIIIY